MFSFINKPLLKISSVCSFNKTKPIESLRKVNQTRKQEREEAEPLRFASANRRGSASIID